MRVLKAHEQTEAGRARATTARGGGKEHRAKKQLHCLHKEPCRRSSGVPATQKQQQCAPPSSGSSGVPLRQTRRTAIRQQRKDTIVVGDATRLAVRKGIRVTSPPPAMQQQRARNEKVKPPRPPPLRPGSAVTRLKERTATAALSQDIVGGADREKERQEKNKTDRSGASLNFRAPRERPVRRIAGVACAAQCSPSKENRSRFTRVVNYLIRSKLLQKRAQALSVGWAKLGTSEIGPGEHVVWVFPIVAGSRLTCFVVKLHALFNSPGHNGVTRRVTNERSIYIRFKEPNDYSKPDTSLEKNNRKAR